MKTAGVVRQAVVSVDGYIAHPDDTVGPLFDWHGNGDGEIRANDTWTFHVSRASADYVQPFWTPSRMVQGDRVLHLHYTVDRDRNRAPVHPS